MLTLSAHYASPGRLAKLETLARKVFVDVDASVRLQLVRDRIIDGQEKCALRRHLDSVGPDTAIADIVDRCHVWESHEEIDSRRGVNPKLNRPHAVFQVTDSNNNEQDETSTGLDIVENLIKQLLPSPAETTLETAPVCSDYELLAQRLCEMAQPPVPLTVIQSHRLTSEPVLTSVSPSFRKRPNAIAVETRKKAGVPTARPVDIVPMPQVIVDENRCNGTVSVEMFPEEPDVDPAKIAEEANTGGATNKQHLHDDQNFKKTTITKLPTDFIEIPKPTLP